MRPVRTPASRAPRGREERGDRQRRAPQEQGGAGERIAPLGQVAGESTEEAQQQEGPGAREAGVRTGRMP